MTKPTMPVLSLINIGFDYPGLRVIDRIDVNIERGEFIVCVGPSGCGKTTLLSILGGHVVPTRGSITRSGASRTIYQDGSLFPWLTVRQNLASSLPPTLASGQRAQKIAEWLGITNLVDFAEHYPHQLSGGMRQRCELARALAAETDILLLDEPFSALDYQTRTRMRKELVATLAQRPRTVVFVTHDIEEAVQLGDRVVVLSSRPTKIKRILELHTPRPRSPAAVGVAEAEQVIMDELGL
jgi:NitT/TauT family transport system ATP-binding protein